jgi:hypothetical protein
MDKHNIVYNEIDKNEDNKDDDNADVIFANKVELKSSRERDRESPDDHTKDSPEPMLKNEKASRVNKLAMMDEKMTPITYDNVSKRLESDQDSNKDKSEEVKVIVINSEAKNSHRSNYMYF